MLCTTLPVGQFHPRLNFTLIVLLLIVVLLEDKYSKLKEECETDEVELYYQRASEADPQDAVAMADYGRYECCIFRILVRGTVKPDSEVLTNDIILLLIGVIYLIPA
jgi:hypothetical protein